MTNENDKRNVAVIAGMAAGFGETLARELSQAGYAVAGLSRTAAKVSDLAQEIGHSGSLYRDYACNLGNADQVARRSGLARDGTSPATRNISLARARGCAG
jgi:NADP-dependent 3-hydroxy acid dehydrogenase YdfG